MIWALGIVRAFWRGSRKRTRRVSAGMIRVTVSAVV